MIHALLFVTENNKVRPLPDSERSYNHVHNILRHFDD